MRTRLLLFLVSSIIVFGCVQQAEELQLVPETRDSSVIFAPPVENTPCTAENPCVTVHAVVLDSVGVCPDDVKLGSQDVVKFVNQTDQNVRITGLNNTGRMTRSGMPVQARLSEKPMIMLSRAGGHGRPGPDDSLGTVGFLQVLRNPYKRNKEAPGDSSLTFGYRVMYQGKDCYFDQGGEERFWSVPPTMIVGPDTL